MFPTKLVVSSRSFIENMARSIIRTAIFLIFGFYSFVSKADIPQFDVDSVLLHANRKIESKQYNEAIALLDSFIIFQQKQPHLNAEVLAQAYLTKGVCYHRSGDFQKSIAQILESISYAEKASDSTILAEGFRELGYCYVFSGKYDEALDSYTKALEIDKGLNDLTSISVDLNSIGKIFELWTDFDKALDFFNQSLQIAQEQNNLHQVAVRKASIASVYKSMKRYEEALKWLKESLALEIELGRVVEKGYRLDQIGEIYTLMERYDVAEGYLKQALTIFEENQIQSSLSIVANHLAVNHMHKGDVRNAIGYFQKSLTIAKRIGFSNMILKNSQELSMLFEDIGDFANALTYYKRFFQLKDSIYSENAQRQLKDFQAKYHTEQKEKELVVLNQEKLLQELELNRSNQQKYFMIGLSLVLIMLLTTLYHRYLIRKRLQAQLTVINDKLQELNNTKNKIFSVLAHDLRNSMWAFSNITESLNKNFDLISTGDLKSYLANLSNSASTVKDLLKNLLEWAKSQQNAIVVTKTDVNITQLVNQSINHVSYTSAQKNIQIKSRLEDNITISTDEDILYIVLRNLINNAVKYTLPGGEILIDAAQLDGMLNITVSDNGVGMSKEQMDKIFNFTGVITSPGTRGEKGSGLGLMLSYELVTKLGGAIAVESELNKGSRFTISVPIK